MTSGLTLVDLSVRRVASQVVAGASLTVRPGELVGLIGPNGAGKTSLMRAALGLLPLAEGTSSLLTFPARHRARMAAWLPQSRDIVWPVSVETVVALGRIPHLPRGRALSLEDRTAVDRALDRMNLSALRHRTATELSGGEQARVLIARTLAQEAPILIADEPVAGLDPGAQIATMQVFTDLATEGHTVLVSLHDLGLAGRHCDRLVLMDRGRIVADGSPEAVLTPALMRDVFGITLHVSQTTDGAIVQPLEVVT